MSKAPAGIVEQAESLVAAARLLPADEAAKVLEQVSVIAQAAQAEVLAAAERSGEILDSGCRSVRSFAATILRRSPEDASQLALVAHHLAALPTLAEAYRAGQVHTANMRAVLAHLTRAGWACCRPTRTPCCTSHCAPRRGRSTPSAASSPRSTGPTANATRSARRAPGWCASAGSAT